MENNYYDLPIYHHSVESFVLFLYPLRIFCLDLIFGWHVQLSLLG